MEALNVLMKKIEGRDSRPSSAGSIGSASSRSTYRDRYGYAINRSTTASSGSRPVSEQILHRGMHRNYSDASYNAIQRGGNAVASRDEYSSFY